MAPDLGRSPWRRQLTDPRVDRAIVERGALVTRAGPLVPWWSFAKTVLAAAALALVRDGALALDAPIESEPYTLRQLLQHRAGFGDYGELPEYHAAVARGDDPWPVDELLRRSRGCERRYSPGSGWQYSNIGYLKVCQLIERTTHRSPSAVLQCLVFDPLGTTTARFAATPDDLRDVTMGDAGAYHPGWVYHGLLVGTLGDAALLLDRLLGGALLPAPLLAEMQAAIRVGPPIPGRPWLQPGYGLGLMREMATADGPLGHTGGGPGSSIAVYRRDRGGNPITIAASCTSTDLDLVERQAAGLS